MCILFRITLGFYDVISTSLNSLTNRPEVVAYALVKTSYNKRAIVVLVKLGSNYKTGSQQLQLNLIIIYQFTLTISVF